MTSNKYISQKQRRARKYVGKFQRKMKKEISTGLQNIVKQCNQQSKQIKRKFKA